MKRIAITLLLGIFFLTACEGTAPLSPTAMVSVSNSVTSTPSPTATATQTLLPSSTPTASITPLPTIPTFTPTFDVSTIVTVTPAPKAECPKEDPNLIPTFYVPKFPGCFDKDKCLVSGTEEEILKFLNSGGTIQSAIAKLRTAIYGDYDEYAYQDVTGDNIPELIFIDFSTMGRLHIFSCNQGNYQVFSSKLDLEYAFADQRQKPIVQDLNLDGIPEVIFLQGYTNNCCNIHTFEWDGQTFQDLSPDAETSTGITIEDVDKNGAKDIIATDISSLSGFYGIPYFGSADFNIPQVRQFTRAYSWNGIYFVFASERLEPPQYRFQAVQDADYAAIKRKYDQALLLYQDAISSKRLNWWSVAQYQFLKNKYNNGNATLLSSPIEDPSEHPRLAAYAYYRIMLLHLAQNHESDATTVYNTLQQKFGNDQYGHPYVEMATAFWNAYQSAHKMYDGCAAAIQYAAEHPEILAPLGSDYHGSQSHIYVPDDVCPFR